MLRNKYFYNVSSMLLVVTVLVTGSIVSYKRRREQVGPPGQAQDQPRLMTAIVASDFGANWSDFSKLSIAHVPIPPDPPPDRIRVRNLASALTPHDQQYATEYGLYGPPTGPFGPYNYGPGFIPGVNYAGLVDATGGGPECLHLGDGPGGIRVFGSTAEECLAEYCNVFCKFAAPVPHGLDLITAASLPDVTMTAVSAYKIAGAPWIPANGSDFTVAISSGSGGTGTVAIQLARIYGATKVYTVGSRKNHEYLRSLGATDVFDYHETTLWEALPKASVDVFYDNRGNNGFCKACAPDHVEKATEFIKPGGYYLYLPSAEETEQIIFL